MYRLWSMRLHLSDRCPQVNPQVSRRGLGASLFLRPDPAYFGRGEKKKEIESRVDFGIYLERTKMISQPHENSLSGKLAERIAIVPLLFAVVLGNSLIRFHEILFPPKISRLDFWAFCVVYLSAFASWFGWHEAAYRYPYTRQPVARIRAGLEAMVALSWAALLFMASQAADSLHGYLWRFVVIFGIHVLVIIVRRIEWRSLDAGYQPLRGTVIYGLWMALASAFYTVCVLAFSPIPS